ncbi:MAG: DUF3352 domain-containing protein [Armatimonadetes bacterium]|nr:DUF3352 domain-containing protein [Armatimonadota bacterium]
MSEQEISIAEPRRKRAMPLIVLLIIVLAATSVGYWLVSTLRARSDPAALIPKDVALALTVDLTKSQGKDAAMKVITGVFEECGVKDPIKKFFQGVDRELGISTEKDVVPKLNGQLAVAVLPEMTGFLPSVVLIVGTRNDGAASDLMEFVAEKLRVNKVRLKKLEYEGFNYYYIPQETDSATIPFYIGAVEKAVIGTIGEGAFKKVADTAKGKPSLLNDSNYVSLRKTSPATFATGYFSGANYYKLIGPYLSMGMCMVAPEAPDLMKQSLENIIATVGTADANADGIELGLRGVSKESASTIEQVPVEELASIAPRNAALVISAAGFDTMWSETKKQLNAIPGLKTQIDQTLVQFRQMLKIDPFSEALDRIKTIGFYYVPKPAPNPEVLPGSLVFVLKVDKPAVIARTLSKIHTATAMMGSIKFKEVTVAGRKLSFAPADKYGTRIWHMLSGDKLLVGITGADFKSSARDAVVASDGKGESVTSSVGFELVKRQLPAQSAYLIYGDAGMIVKAFSKEMTAEDHKIAATITKTVGTFGAAGSNKGTRYETLVVVPFKK